MIQNGDHYNLYYIFEEDKRRHPLSAEAAAQLWENILHVICEDKP